jgi:hypothetical protein
MAAPDGALAPEGIMPEVSRFFGIVIAMFYEDHLPPHFHARYGHSQMLVGIEELKVLWGQLPPRAIGLVMEWAAVHQDELREDWILARQQVPLKKIAPLE